MSRDLKDIKKTLHVLFYFFSVTFVIGRILRKSVRFLFPGTYSLYYFFFCIVDESVNMMRW